MAYREHMSYGEAAQRLGNRTRRLLKLYELNSPQDVIDNELKLMARAVFLMGLPIVFKRDTRQFSLY